MLVAQKSLVELELFGVDRSFRYQEVKKKLLSALERSGVDYALSDVGEISKFIEVGLASVPAIRVDHEKLFAIDKTGDIQSTVQLVFDYIKNSKMRSLIVPIDFSACSKNAAEYAKMVAPYFGLKLECLHVHHPVVDPHNAVILDPDLGGQLQAKLTEWQKEIEAQDEGQEFSCVVSSRFEIGYPVQVILDVVKEASTALVVMGTLGASDVVDQIFGSNSSSVAVRASKPVLLIPSESAFRPYEKITVAFDEEILDEGVLEKLLQFNKPFNAHIDFLHVQRASEDKFEHLQAALTKKIFEAGTPEFSMDIREIGDQDKDIAQNIRTYIDANPTDLLVITSRQRSYLQRLFHSSVSKNICLHSKGPVLVLHV